MDTLLVVLVEEESVSQVSDGLLTLKTRQAGAQHRDDVTDNQFTVWSHGQEPLNEQFFKHLERFGIAAATHDTNHLLSQLEWNSFKLDTTGNNIKAETEINV
ncbi:hypothetical protein WICPIJ_006289 [Wickerhamomyces pijperi]|uniref:Uncharacterized protein n=1 Tax=Wickerhamomyces pijperi TaxID=599730 RepID=A0A9P8Q4Q5_WICPI|nr:hypothetical protein WICPIJ_006289 [Wickerhamomyces pijperi]